MEKPIINCHTHSFNFDCVPDAFLSNYIQRFMAKIAATLLRFRILATPILIATRLFANGNTRKMIDFALIGNSKSIENVFSELKQNYEGVYPDARIVVLTMNFDYMDGKGSPGLFRTQLEQMKKLKAKYQDVCLPFLGIDPRMEDHGENLDNFLNEYFNKELYSGFVGLKLYPSLGFYPFNPRMEKVYAFADANNLPIMTHCTPDGAFYADKQVPESLQIPISFNPLTNLSPVPLEIFQKSQNLRQEIVANYNKKPSDFCDYFLHPLNYWDVLVRFPKLKLCLAHCGGEETITQNKPTEVAKNWYEDIKTILKHEAFENVFADVSFVLHNDDAVKKLKEDMENDPILASKILFGTDFFMTVRIKNERDLVEDFRKIIGEVLWKQLAIDNPRRYLTSDFYLA